MGERKRILSRRDFLNLGLGASLAAAFGGFKTESPVESATKVRFGKDRIARVNEESVFPIGIFYFLEGSADDPDLWKMVANSFNTVTGWGVNEQTLSMTEEYGLWFVADLDLTFNGYYTGFSDTRTPLITDKDRVKEVVATSGSFLAWLGVDEPGIQKDMMLSSHQKLREFDPYHPLWTNFFEFPGRPDVPLPYWALKDNYPGRPEDLTGLPDEATYHQFQNWWNNQTGAQITGFDVGLPDYIGDNFSYGALSRSYFERLKKGETGKEVKALWTILSAHSGIQRSYESFRFQAIEQIANGATGLFFWDFPPGCHVEDCEGYPFADGYASHWDKIAKVGWELKGLMAGLTGRIISESTVAGTTTAYKITAAEGKHYVFAANGSEMGLAKIPHLPPNTLFSVNGIRDLFVNTDESGNLLWTFPPLTAEVFVEGRIFDEVNA